MACIEPVADNWLMERFLRRTWLATAAAVASSGAYAFTDLRTCGPLNWLGTPLTAFAVTPALWWWLVASSDRIRIGRAIIAGALCGVAATVVPTLLDFVMSRLRHDAEGLGGLGAAVAVPLFTCIGGAFGGMAGLLVGVLQRTLSPERRMPAATPLPHAARPRFAGLLRNAWLATVMFTGWNLLVFGAAQFPPQVIVLGALASSIATPPIWWGMVTRRSSRAADGAAAGVCITLPVAALQVALILLTLPPSATDGTAALMNFGVVLFVMAPTNLVLGTIVVMLERVIRRLQLPVGDSAPSGQPVARSDEAR